MKKIDADTSVYELVEAHPDILVIMAGLGFRDITKPGMLKTAGRVMTLKKGAAMKKIAWERIKKAFAENGYVFETREGENDERDDQQPGIPAAETESADSKTA